MKVSLKWLSKYVDISSLTPEELSSIISKAGTEIEEISYFAKGTNLVVGEVIECEDIEGTHLHKTLVDIGHGGNVDDNLLFAGHQVYRFANDPLYANGYVPTTKELIEAIKAGR